MTQPVHQFTDLLVLQQPAHQLGARILPFVIAETAREQQLRLDAQQARGHFEIIGGLVESQLIDDGEKLIGDLGDWQIGDVDFVFADEMQQQVERARKLLQLDDEPGLLPHARSRHHWSPNTLGGSAFGNATGMITCFATMSSWKAGHKKKRRTPGSR